MCMFLWVMGLWGCGVVVEVGEGGTCFFFWAFRAPLVPAEGLIGRCAIEREGLISKCYIERMVLYVGT
jgi:hypothetical protein